MSGPEIKVGVTFEAVTIHIGGMLHLHVKRPILGMQSWVMRNEGKWVIQFTVAGGAEITADYDDIEKWTAILAGLEKVL